MNVGYHWTIIKNGKGVEAAQELIAHKYIDFGIA